MLRTLNLLLCTMLVAFAASAAPAPVYKPDLTPWFGIRNWDKPFDPIGDCRFVRHGDELTITVPGKGHGWYEDEDDKLNVPRLVREVRGDFSVQVRVSGAFDQTGESGGRSAGIILLHGKSVVGLVCRAISEKEYRDSGVCPVSFIVRTDDGSIAFVNGDWPEISVSGRPAYELRRPAYLRLERQKGTLIASLSDDGTKWTVDPRLNRWKGEMNLPDSLKVGVVAGATAPGTFEAVFDQFELTPR